MYLGTTDCSSPFAGDLSTCYIQGVGIGGTCHNIDSSFGNARFRAGEGLSCVTGKGRSWKGILNHRARLLTLQRRASRDFHLLHDGCVWNLYLNREVTRQEVVYTVIVRSPSVPKSLFH